jgi:hypothetical protein
MPTVKASVMLFGLLGCALACDREPPPQTGTVASSVAATNVDAAPEVPLVPPAEALEVAPGTYVLTVFRRPQPGARVEEIGEIYFFETVYDATGRNAATSVPSSTWALLPEEYHVILAGMQAGDRRRIWKCDDGRKGPCRVEDVQVFDGAEVDTR